MKAGERYIIEIETVTDGIAKIKGFNTLVFDKHGLNKLQQIESGVNLLNSAALAQIKARERQEGYIQGFKDGVKHQENVALTKGAPREPQIGDVYRNKSDTSLKAIITYSDDETYTVLLPDGDYQLYNTEELNKYFEFIENRGDILGALKGVLI